MLIKNSKIIYIDEFEEPFVDEIISSYESDGWRLVLQRELIEDGSDCPYTWILGFAKREEKDI